MNLAVKFEHKLAIDKTTEFMIMYGQFNSCTWRIYLWLNRNRYPNIELSLVWKQAERGLT